MANMFETFQQVIDRLEQANIPYMVVGSIASMIYGEPRMTKDMDLVIDIHPQDGKRFSELFPLSDFYCPPYEILSHEVVERGQFNLIHHESGLKIDIVLRKNTEHSRLEFSRRQKIPFWKNFDAYVASPEDVIVKKLSFYREGGSEKHINDIRGILAQTEVDRAYIEGWIQKLGLQEVWQKVCS